MTKDERRSSIHSDVDDGDDTLLLCANNSDQQYELFPLGPIDDSLLQLNGSRESESDDNEPLLSRDQRDQVIEKTSHRCSYVPARYMIAIWAFFGFFCLFAMRVNLSIAIVAMVSRFFYGK